MWSVFRCVLMRDITLAMRRRTDVMTTLFFFLIVVSLFPLGVGTEKETLRILGPGCDLGGGAAGLDVGPGAAVRRRL